MHRLLPDEEAGRHREALFRCLYKVTVPSGKAVSKAVSLVLGGQPRNSA